MESLWRKQTKEIRGRAQEADVKLDRTTWDVIVIGAGMAGILTAFYLQEAGKKVLVLEADRICGGQTEGTTAKITSQHGIKYSTLIKSVGMEAARGYALANEKAIREYEKLIKNREIDCQFERRTAYLYSLREKNSLVVEKRAALSMGIDVVTEDKGELPFQVKGVIGFPNQAQFSPLKFARNIAAELTILENCRVTELKEHLVIAEKKVFTAEKIVVATHYPIMDIPGFYFLRQHQSRSYVLALSGCKRIEGMYYGVDREGLSFRQAGDHLLLGGASHRTGENKKGGAYEYLEEMARKYYPNCQVEAKWSAQDCMPHDGIPFIGKYSFFTPNIYVITGFQKWGMTFSMIAALILRDEIMGTENTFGKIFNPQRFHLKASLPHLLTDVGVNIKSLTKALFTDKPSCAHLGCKLEWNPDEQSWECPCHGSRYTGEGKLVDNPSVKDLEE
ncbi:MAG: FAD-dependent oxidoreductase [Lachnospiraceae bacterium]|nr:FAD-dependent oxidoreductase [Lachnospiraceae bacterium]